jgi:hypothetical protein
MQGTGPYLQASVQALFDRLLNPNCVDAGGHVLGPSQGGQCASGTAEFKPVEDIHVAITTSSLGGRKGDLCPDSATVPGNPALSAHTNDQAHLVNRTGPTETPLPDALPDDFLAWFPSVPQNQGKPAPPDPAIGTETQLVGDFQAMLADTGVHGCGFGAPLEAWYRFLVQPDPYSSIDPNGLSAAYIGVDATILQQRHDFLRPDSAVAIIVVANETERVDDPLSIGAQGWAFDNSNFPGSPTGAAPEGTIECQTNPYDPSCTSCAFVSASDPSFATRCPKDGANGANGYLDPMDDPLNLRHFHMKQRFGLDAQFPIDRYATGLTSPSVPDRTHEHDSAGNYVPVANCTNPLFASQLPTSPTSELCCLPAGPRQASQVFLAVIGGVPHQLLQQDPSNPDSPQKTSLSPADWTAILGNDPLKYDFTGADFHMLESAVPRAQSPCPPTSANNCDPISGREIDTGGADLQPACTYALATPVDCTQSINLGACQCAIGVGSQLCNGTTQVEGEAYPAIRPLSLARALGPQAVVSSICPIHTTESAPGDPLYGYRPAFGALVDSLATALAK